MVLPKSDSFPLQRRVVGLILSVLVAAGIWCPKASLSATLMATGEVNKPPSLPPYPEMIIKAIEAVDEKNGCNKSTISKYIESTYGELPAGHSALLSLHLNKMRESGQLEFWKNNYTKRNRDAPARRGRGRPPKAKVPLPPGTVVSPPRPRGRPPKDLNAPPKPLKVKCPPEEVGLGGGPGKMARPSGGWAVLRRRRRRRQPPRLLVGGQGVGLQRRRLHCQK